MRIQLFTSLLISGLIVSCHFGKSPSAEVQSEGRVPVTITTVKIGTLNETVELNAISQFLLKTTIKSTANGYLQEMTISPGQPISKGEKLFVVRSKESKSLGNTVDKLDSMLHFNGKIQINAPGNGFILQLTYRDGDYVQDGEVLATIGDSKSLVFLLELPYELLPFLHLNKTVLLTLPDGKQLKGIVTNSMPSMDAQSQTQSYIIRIDHGGQIPENLVAKVQFVKKLSSNALILPKAALLTDEIQGQFWVMLMSDKETAIKVPVVKGIEAGDSVEIVSPHFTVDQQILLTGNYGLPDTAKVVIEK
ncbi:MAG: HlyD family efflux transporter periplasmic adaptor subunit [Prolixibacteraceae bacterium]